MANALAVFKQGAIEYAWQWLTRELAIDPKHLVVTVFGGEPSLKLGPDDEARALWKKVAASVTTASSARTNSAAVPRS